uniref:Retrovirus-related Pol polyprotein from transposon TNT 1-94 n=1 Tax=Tanacetum cinerariifolium TaxID=118510 RepID=A0A6L2J6Y0_TANCI|nr:retrovirus-related Pol polyprotein from transposon TNT 1-94 [Tanacetum cinerariifolium]
MIKALNENERLLEQVISKDIVNIIVNSSVDTASVNVQECEKYLKLETELLTKRISDNFVSNQSALTFYRYFKLNELKAQSQEKDTIISKLKERIKSLSGNKNTDKIKKNIEEIETINIELDHRVSKLIAKNEHLKQTYKQLYDSIKQHEKGLVITALKNNLRKLRGKSLVDDVVTSHTIAPKTLKVDVEQLAPKLLNNKTAHSNYLRHTQEQAVIPREVVKQGKSYNPLNNSLNHASRQGLVRDLLKLKFEKDHLCSACAMGKSKKKPHKPKSEDTNQEKLYLLHMDLYGTMRVASVNGKNYIFVIVDDYSRFTWVKCLRSKDEAPDFIINKTPYELLQEKILDLLFFYVFGALHYPTNDSKNLGKLQPKANISIFIGYAPTKKAFWIYSRRTRRIIETIHVDFDDLAAMASEHSSSGPTLHEMTTATISSRLVPNNPPSTPCVPPSRSDWNILFQPMFDELLTPPPSVDHPAPVLEINK